MAMTEFKALRPWAYRLRWLAVVMTAAPWVFNALRHLPSFVMLGVLALYGLVGLTLILPQRIAVGDDGVALTWAGRRRFVSYAQIEGIRLTPLGVDLDLVTGRVVEIRLTHHHNAKEEQCKRLEAAIRDAMATYRGLGAAGDAAIVTRGSRSVEQWITEMGTIGDRLEGYRSIAIPRERLWDLIENPAADPSAREGAALALRVQLDEDERTRLRDIARRSASPRLRVALDAVATAPDEARLRVALEIAEDTATRDALGEDEDPVKRARRA